MATTLATAFFAACAPEVDQPDDIATLYHTSVRPPDDAPHSVWVPETVETEDGLVRKLVSYTETYEILDFYPSMRGPQSYLQARLGAPAQPELLWVKGVHAEIVDAQGERISQEFMCHLVAGIGTIRGRDRALDLVTSDARIATLSQGVYHKEYPPGFAVPVLSSDLLVFNSQVLNLNRPDEYHRVRHKIVTLVIRDSERRRPLQALTNTYAQTMVVVGEGGALAHPGVHAPREEIHGLGCSVGENADPRMRVWRDEYGQAFAGHWLVEPGRREYHTSVTKLMGLRHDTTLHAIDVHLHPFAESLELRDVTLDETVFKSRTRQVESGVGLEHVDIYSSVEGIPLYRDHQYALVATYDNPTGEPQDAMALMYLAVRDPEFDPTVLGADAEARMRREHQRWQRAAEQWEKALAEDPDDYMAHYKKGIALARLGRLDAAIAALERVLEIQPDHEGARLELAQARARLEGAAPSASEPLPNAARLD